MHGAGARTPAVAALVVAVKEPMLLLHHMSLSFFCNEAQRALLFPVHMFPPLQMQQHPIQMWQRLRRLIWWSQSPRVLFASALMTLPQNCLV